MPVQPIMSDEHAKEQFSIEAVITVSSHLTPAS
jgi:hypothetical protein